MRVILWCLVIFIVTLSLSFAYDIVFFRFQGKGVWLDDQLGRITFISHPDTAEKISLTIPSAYSFSQRSLVKDEMLSHQHHALVEEYTFRTILSENSSELSLELLITARYFDNADSLIFFRCSTMQDMPEELWLEFSFPLNRKAEAHLWSLNYESLFKPNEMTAPNSTMDQTILHDLATSYPSTLHYIETLFSHKDASASILLGPGAIFKNKDFSLRELQSSEVRPIIQHDKTHQSLIVRIPVRLQKDQYQENWLMHSSRSLLDYHDPLTVQNMLSADFTMRKKLSIDGIYHIASSQYYVGASDETYDYYYNYAMWEGRRFMDLHREKPDQRFFYNFFINSVYTTVKAARRYGVWVSDVRSIYLWSSYQIPEGYIDTRYCTDAGFFLLRSYNEYQIPDALSAGEKFGDFLLNKMNQSKGIHTGQDGFFFYDYYRIEQDIETHASLNHILSEMNYLFELYLSNHKQSYLRTAERMLKGLHETGMSWVRDQEYGRFRYDLWYGVFPQEDGSLLFKEHDYTKTLTYNDLLKSQALIQGIYNKRDDLIDIMISSKLKFFAREGIVVPE